MAKVEWHMSNVRGVKSGEVARLVTIVACAPSTFKDEKAEYGACHEFEVWVPVELSDLGAIERAAFDQLRQELAVLAASLPTRA